MKKYNIQIKPEAKVEYQRAREKRILILGILLGIIGNLLANIIDSLVKNEKGNYPLYYILMLFIFLIIVVYLLYKTFYLEILLYKSRKTLNRAKEWNSGQTRL